MHTTLLLDMAADAAPDRLALGRREDGVTFSDLQRRARAGAVALEAAGGDTVTVTVPGRAVSVPDHDARDSAGR